MNAVNKTIWRVFVKNSSWATLTEIKHKEIIAAHKSETNEKENVF